VEVDYKEDIALARFDRAFGETSTQKDIFEFVKPNI